MTETTTCVAVTCVFLMARKKFKIMIKKGEDNVCAKRDFFSFFMLFLIIILIFIVGQMEERKRRMKRQHVLPFLSSFFLHFGYLVFTKLRSSLTN